MSGIKSKLTVAAVMLSLCAVPTGAIAANPAPAPAVSSTSATPQAADPWLALSAMSSSTTVASSSAAAAAAQDYDRRGGWSVAWPALAVILVTIGVAIWILVDDDDSDLDIDRPGVSPT